MPTNNKHQTCHQVESITHCEILHVKFSSHCKISPTKFSSLLNITTKFAKSPKISIRHDNLIHRPDTTKQLCSTMSVFHAVNLKL